MVVSFLYVIEEGPSVEYVISDNTSENFSAKLKGKVESRGTFPSVVWWERNKNILQGLVSYIIATT